MEKQGSLKEKEAELLAKKQELISQGYWEEGRVIGDINAKLAENAQAQADAATAAEEATKRKIVAMIESKMMADKVLTDAEFNSLVDLQGAWGLMSQDAVKAAKDTNAAVNQYLETGDIDAFTKSVDGVAESILNMPEEKTVQINFVTTINDLNVPVSTVYALLNME